MEEREVGIYLLIAVFFGCCNPPPLSISSPGGGVRKDGDFWDSRSLSLFKGWSFTTRVLTFPPLISGDCSRMGPLEWRPAQRAKSGAHIPLVFSLRGLLVS